MEEQHTAQRRPRSRILLRVVVCALVLAAGAAGMMAMIKMKKPPAEVRHKERALQVETLTARPEDVQVRLTGYGEIRALNVVTLSAEVSGRIAAVHPRLDAGEIIPEGEVLFQIDDRDYRAALTQAEAAAAQAAQTLARLKTEYDTARQRLKTLERNKQLAMDEYARLRRLYTENDVGTRSGVDGAEQAYNLAADQAEQMAQAVAVYPIQIKEQEHRLDSEKARVDMARTNLARCTVTAPFDGRIKDVSLETGQYVAPGQAAVTLADDSVLEMHAPLDSRDAAKWLRFADKGGAAAAAWFDGLAPTACAVRWTEDVSDHVWEGRLHRVVKFDRQTRTLTVAVRIAAEDAASGDGFPLVEGMFCSVEIPGKTMKDVIRLPRWAVSFKNTAYVSSDGRLKTVPVTVVRVQGDEAFVDQGLNPGDAVIVTRLVDPLENALLDIANHNEEDVRS